VDPQEPFGCSHRRDTLLRIPTVTCATARLSVAAPRIDTVDIGSVEPEVGDVSVVFGSVESGTGAGLGAGVGVVVGAGGGVDDGTGLGLGEGEG